MVTKSIVGRFLILTVLLVSLGVIAQAAFLISSGAAKKVVSSANAAPAPVQPVPVKVATNASTPSTDPAPLPTSPPSASGEEAAPVRVVYPGPLGNAPIPLRKIADTASMSPLAPPVSPPAPLVAPPSAPSDPAPAATTASQTVSTPATLRTPAVSSVDVASADAGAVIPAAPASSEATTSGQGSVNLNSASVEALNNMGAGHIGQSIIKHRPYHSVDDLMKKRVVRRSVFEQIKNQVAAE